MKSQHFLALDGPRSDDRFADPQEDDLYAEGYMS
jgi:hypothetical protein